MSFAIILGFFVLLYLFPSALAVSITKWSKDPVEVVRKVRNKNTGKVQKKKVKVQPNLEPKEAILCYIPIVSAMMVWKAVYGNFGWTKFVAPIIPIGVIFRIITVFFTQSELLFIVSFYALWVCMILHQLLYTIVYFVTARLYSFGIVTQVLCIILPEFAAYPLSSNVPKIMREIMEEEDETFGE